MSVSPYSDEIIPLAEDFPTLTHEQWQDLVAKVLNRGRPEDKQLTGEQSENRLRTTTVDGLTIDALYTAEDVPSATGYPGVMPYTRGSGLRRFHEAPWDVRALHEDPDPAVTRPAILADLERGATSIWLAVGQGAISTDDVPAVLGDVLLDIAPVVVSSDTDQKATADALKTVWRDRGLTKKQALGFLGFDPLGLAARNGGAPEFAAMREATVECVADYPQVRSTVIDTLIYHDAGAGDVDELALAIATGIAYLRELEGAGVTPEQAFGQINFRVSATADQFLTTARLRALRLLWARVGEACGVPEPSRAARQHAVTSWRMISRDDPWVNMLRATIATFAASAGSAEAITVLPFDTAWGLPDTFSRRLARNTQILLAEESNIGKVIDPGGGSYYLESLTTEMARAAWSWVQKIEADGGMATALANGQVAERIAATAAERDQRLATRKLPLTGVSMFPKPDEEPLTRKPRPEAPAAAGGLVPRRDSAIFEALRDRSAAAASSGKPPTALLACLGARRDFGPRETFTHSFLGVSGIATPTIEGATGEQIVARAAEIGTSLVFLCSSAKVYAEQAADVIAALRAAGIDTIYLAGQAAELGEQADQVDGVIYDGIDVVQTLDTVLGRVGVTTTSGGSPAAVEGTNA